MRALFPQNAKILALISSGQVVDGKVTKKAGLIGKKPTMTRRAESFSYYPKDRYKTVATGGTNSCTVSDASDLHTRMKVVKTNGNTKETAIIDAISGTTLTLVNPSGSDFVVAAGDTIAIAGNAYEENSSNPQYVMKDEDQVYNVTQICRFPVAISGTKNATKHKAGGDYWSRIKEQNVPEALMQWERSVMFGDYAASGNTTSMSNLGVEIGTHKGLWQFAQNTIDCSGGMTPKFFKGDMVTEMDPSISSGKHLIMFTSTKAYAEMLCWIDDKYVIQNPNSDLAKFGVKSTRFVTALQEIEVMTHDAFNMPGNWDDALVFNPDMLQYRFMTGRDLKPKSNIQSPSTDGFIDEIIGEACLLPVDLGYSISKVTNMFGL